MQRLTPQELEASSLYVAGHRITLIATWMRCTPDTVRSAVARACRKHPLIRQMRPDHRGRKRVVCFSQLSGGKFDIDKI